MLRSSLFLYNKKVTRQWTKKAITSASAHFPSRVVQVDPAAQRTVSNTSAKEQRTWTLTETVIEKDMFKNTMPASSLSAGNRGNYDAMAPQAPKPIQILTKQFLLYRDLVRMDKPVGWQLLCLPCLWGSALAVTRALVWEGADPFVLCAPLIPMHLLISFVAGAYLMRSVGCIVNDMWDREFDRQVERTASRPLASGAMSMQTASFILVSHVTLAGFIAGNLAPPALIACLGITPIWVMYPFMKRITYAPQFFLGLCFNWGIFVGYAAVLGRVDLAVCLPIYISAVIWTILYDTIYAYQDRRDDLKCGVKSTAIWIGDRKHILFAMVPMVGLGMLISGVAASQSLPYYIGVTLSIGYLYHLVDDVNIYDAWSCGRGFRLNVLFGLFIFISMCVGNLCWALASQHEKDKDKSSDSLSHEEKAKSSGLVKYVYLNQQAQERLYDPSQFNTLDRMLHPAFVYGECLKAEKGHASRSEDRRA
ncbi:4-hydroxybenzoate hexaprenyltransferase [Strigomonas culicis]|uniref:4-hydroxybenzoate polyprenyltransferase, mitochondrial n=1 Tax=Strigomonas culicis TaxID=28005 RepID=S9VIC1_9TRYP|nr:4-hydroxybenzoate hexaprenyltransferase [Strigomonas culicis]|eukprot:EPY26846.1 4-hydroxybenzoate hexaprenyltransferase [Strigomonas culicis]